MNDHMNGNTRSKNGNRRTWLIITALIVVAVVGFLVALWASVFRVAPSPFQRRVPPSPYVPPFGDLQIFYTIETVFSTVNVMLAIVLLLVYISIYRKTHSEFTVGLTIFSAVFLLNALASNPLLRAAFRYHPYGLGPFAMLPDLFTFAALIVLLYLSARY